MFSCGRGCRQCTCAGSRYAARRGSPTQVDCEIVEGIEVHDVAWGVQVCAGDHIPGLHQGQFG